MDILRHADQASGHLAFEFILRGEEAGVRAAETHRHSETLRRADGHIGPEFAGRPQQRERQQVGRNKAHRAGRMGFFKEAGKIVDAAGGVGILHEHAKDLAGDFAGAVVADHDRHIERFGARADDVDGLGVTFFRDEKHRGLVAVAELDAVGQHHRLGRGGAFVEHRSVGDLQARQIRDQSLKVQQRFEPALGNLGLVRRVGGVPAGILENVALDDGRRGRVVVTHADEAAENPVPRSDGPQFGQRGAFAGGGRQPQWTLEPDRGRHGGISQGIERIKAHRLEHRGNVSVGRAGMTAFKSVGRCEQVAGRSHAADGRRGGEWRNCDLAPAGCN